MSYANRVKSEVLTALMHAAAAAHQAHIERDHIPGIRPTRRAVCEKLVCAAIRVAREEARKL